MVASAQGGRWRKAVVPLATAAAAVLLLAWLIASAASTSRWPPMAAVAVFAGFLVLTANVSILNQGDINVSPSLMVIMVTVGAFSDSGAVLAAALVGLSAGVMIRVFTNTARSFGGNLLITAFNCGECMLAATGAAIVYGQLRHGGIGHVVLAAAGAALAYAAVNVVLVLASMAVEGLAVSDAWEDMRPALPSVLAFGVIGILAGQLYSGLGMMSLALLVVPVLIARRTYRSGLVLREAQAETIRVFMRALEAKDLYTARHTERVAQYATFIGEELGFRGARMTHLQQAAYMHDIGKLAVASRLLNKPGRLTADEYAEVRRHNEVCVSLLSQVAFLRSTIPVASDAHGVFDADLRRGDGVALEGYIVAVGDAFDAMTSTRAYRKALPMEVAFEELRKGKGTQFEPECVEALIRAIDVRDLHLGAGYESDAVEFAVEPPSAGVGSAGLGQLELPSLPSRRTNRSRMGEGSPFNLA